MTGDIHATLSDVDEKRSDLRRIGQRLDQRGLSGLDAPIPGETPTETLSLRVPGNGFVLSFTPAGGSLAYVREPHMLALSLELDVLDGDGLPDHVRPLAALHAAFYRARPDAGAILTNRQEWGSSLHLLDHPMPAAFDEQARQLGPSVLPMPNDPVATTGCTPSLTRAAQSIAGSGANAFLMGEGVLLLGMTPARVLFNAELLEKCAKAYLLAVATGNHIPPLPFYVRYIAHRRLLKDESRSADAYARGETPGGFTAY